MKLPVMLVTLLLSHALPAVDAREQLDRFASDLNSLSAGFDQFTIDAGGRMVDEVAGRLYFLAPDRFRWDYDDPFPQLIVADGEQLWHYDESLEQVTVRAQPAPSDSPLMVLTRPELLDRFYRIEPTDQPGLIEFRPLEPDAEFEWARLRFEEGIPVSLDLVDRFGQTTRIALIDLERNPLLDPDLFRFEPPEGVDVLEGL